MVKVLMFGWEFPPFHSGGLGIACQGLTNGLKKTDAEVIFVLPKRTPIPKDWMKFVFADDESPIKTTYFVNSMLHGYVTSGSYDSESARKSLFYAGTLAQEVERYAQMGAKIAEKEEFDVIHAHDWLTYQAGIAAKKVSGKKLVIHVHATEFDRGGGNGVNQHIYDIEKRGMEEADKIIAVSNFTKNKIIKHYGIDPGKVTVVHNAVEFEESVVEELHDLKRDKKIVLSLGRITLQKGIDYFVSTARKVLDHYPKALFVVVGSGDMENKIIRQVADLGMSDKFIFTGWFKGEEKIKQIFKTADMYIMPSVSEPFGITPLESMYMGTPALVSHQSGVSEVATNCLKTDFWDTDEMANKIVSVLRHKELQNTLSENGCAEAKSLTWDKPAKRCVDLYEEMSGGGD